MTKNYSNLAALLDKYELVLASGSPRRVRILKEAGIGFRQIIPDIDENGDPDIPPEQLAVHLAQKKARAVLSVVTDREVILGCDTIVVLKGKILGKPESKEHAFEILSRLSGHKHTVCSAAALSLKNGRTVSGYELTEVIFNPVTGEEIRGYIETGEPLDKAGAYGIQGFGAFLVDRYNGNLDNVIGLPMTLVNDLAGKLLAGN
jgi:septum formation protein